MHARTLGSYYKKTKSKPEAPHIAHQEKVEKKSRRFGILADHIFTKPTMRCGVVHFSV